MNTQIILNLIPFNFDVFRKIRFYMKPNNHTKNILQKLKDKMDIQDNFNLVYRIDCNDCDKYYIEFIKFMCKTDLMGCI